ADVADAGRGAPAPDRAAAGAGGRQVPVALDGPAAARDGADAERITPIPEGEVVELFNALEKAVRARRLYQDNNPVYHGFLRTLHEVAARVFSLGASLTVSVEEGGLRWYGQLIETGTGRDNL